MFTFKTKHLTIFTLETKNLTLKRKFWQIFIIKTKMMAIFTLLNQIYDNFLPKNWKKTLFWKTKESKFIQISILKPKLGKKKSA